MRRHVLFTATLSAVFATATLTALAHGHASAQPTGIEVGDFFFCDSSFQDGVCDRNLTAGSTVTWNVSAGFHTVTQCDASFTTCPPTGGFDSGSLSTGGTFAHTFSTLGTYPYHCSIHPAQMRGRILVQAQPAASPALTATPTPSPGTPTPAGQTPAATSAAVAMLTPAAVPASGGRPGGGSQWPLLDLTIALVGASLATAGAGLCAVRRSAH